MKNQMRKVNSETIKVVTGCGNLSVTETSDNDFMATMGKSGSCKASFINGVSSLIHLLLNINAKVDKIDLMIKEGKIEIKGKEDKETMDRYIGRLKNMSSRDTIIKELGGIQCAEPTVCNGVDIKSCMDGFAYALKRKYVKEEKDTQ